MAARMTASALMPEWKLPLKCDFQISGLRGVERFMKRYYLAARHVGNLTRIFCAALETDFDRRPRLSLKDPGWQIQTRSGYRAIYSGKRRLHLTRKGFRDDLIRLSGCLILP